MRQPRSASPSRNWRGASRALHAITRDDLTAVLTDLLSAERIEEIVGGEPPLGEGPGYSGEDPLVLESERWSELAVVGPWMVPPFLEVQTSIGGVRSSSPRPPSPRR